MEGDKVRLTFSSSGGRQKKRRRAGDTSAPLPFAAAFAEAAAEAENGEGGGDVVASGDDALAQAAALRSEGNALAERGEFTRALNRWDSALRLVPHAGAPGASAAVVMLTATLHELRAQALMAVDEGRETFRAVQSAHEATRLAPSWADAWLTLGRAQLNLGEVNQT